MGDLRRLIAFDLDGTLIDSRRDLADAANALIVELGGAPLTEEAITRMVGEGAAMLVRRALAAAGLRPDERAAVVRFLELYDERLLKTTRPYPGIPLVLDAVAEYATIAVLTNKPLGPSERILKGLGLDRHVATTIGGDSDFPRKPDPASLRHLMAQFGASPATTVMVGDSWIDCETGRAAGTAVILARYGFGFVSADDVPAVEHVVDDPSQLASAIGRVLRPR